MFYDSITEIQTDVMMEQLLWNVTLEYTSHCSSVLYANSQLVIIMLCYYVSYNYVKNTGKR